MGDPISAWNFAALYRSIGEGTMTILADRAATGRQARGSSDKASGLFAARGLPDGKEGFTFKRPDGSERRRF